MPSPRSRTVRWAGVSVALVFSLAELAMRIAAVFLTPDPDDKPVVLSESEGKGFRFTPKDFSDSQEEASGFQAKQEVQQAAGTDAERPMARFPDDDLAP